MFRFKSAPESQVYAGDVIVLKAPDKLVSYEDAESGETRFGFSFFGRLDALKNEDGELDARSVRVWLRGAWTQEAADELRSSVIAGSTFETEGKLRHSKPNDEGKQWPILDVDFEVDTEDAATEAADELPFGD